MDTPPSITAELPGGSVACILKLNVPVVVGIPVILPELLKLKPVGNAPSITYQVYGGDPPIAVRVAL
jgi:hypothetical protein